MNSLVTASNDPVTGAPSAPVRSFFTIEGFSRLWIIFDYADVAYVETLLPDYVQLTAPAPGTPIGKHPMMYSFGTQTVRLHGLPWFSRTYRESIVGVCNVELKRQASFRGPYSLMTSARADSLLATVLGRLLGYPKAFTRLTETERSFHMATFLTNRRLMSGQFEWSGTESRAVASPCLQHVQPFLADPIISKTLWGTLLASRFATEKDTWVFTPVTGEAKVTDDLAGLPTGDYSWNAVGVSVLGAFTSSHHWYLNPPTKAPVR